MNNSKRMADRAESDSMIGKMKFQMNICYNIRHE